MQRRQFISGMLMPALAGASVCGLSGCGAFLHTERCGQPHGNDIDWKIAALDGLGLILFFIPGVVAFAVDFYTGAIYLPIAQSYPGYGASPQVPIEMAPRAPVPPPVINSGPPAAPQPLSGQPQRLPAAESLGLKRVVLPREQLQPQYLEQVVANHVGRPVSLDDPQVRLSELASIDRFDQQLDRHRSDRNFGYGVRSLFSQLNRV